MTIKIKLSSLTIAPEEFAARVKAFADAMLEYVGHLEGVRLDAANETMNPEDRRVAFPPPSEEPLIESAAREGYEFAGPTLDEKKAALFSEVRRMETEALRAIVPPAKARHWQFREVDIRAADRARYQGTIQQLETFDDFSRANRPADDTHFLEEQAARDDKCNHIQRRAAKLDHDIDDLTEETVDSYVIGGAFA